jgi:hypothetical protein
MSLTLTWLVDRQLRNLTGAQFKLAAYLYRRLQREPELTIRAKDLAEATGLSEKSAQSASNHLAKQNILAVIGGPGTTKTYRLPAAQPAKPGAAKPGGSNTIVRSRRQTGSRTAAAHSRTGDGETGSKEDAAGCRAAETGSLSCRRVAQSPISIFFFGAAGRQHGRAPGAPARTRTCGAACRAADGEGHRGIRAQTSIST